MFWVHVWSNTTYGPDRQGSFVEMEAPLEQQPVLYRSDSTVFDASWAASVRELIIGSGSGSSSDAHLAADLAENYGTETEAVVFV